MLRDRKPRCQRIPALRRMRVTLARLARIEYVGHATVFVDLDGVRLLTDPLLRNRVAHLRRSTPVAARTRRGVDAVLISHAHYDHLDLPSLEKLGKKIPVVVPRGLGGLLRKRRFESVIEVEVGETLSDRRAADPGRPRRARREPGPVRRLGGAGRLCRLRVEVDLLRRRHGPLRRDARARARGRRADPDLGLGAGSRRRRSPRSGGRGRGGRADPAEPRDPDPLGHVLPDPSRPDRQARASSTCLR